MGTVTPETARERDELLAALKALLAEADSLKGQVDAEFATSEKECKDGPALTAARALIARLEKP